MTKVNALKKVAVALGYGSDVKEYKGETVAAVLKELAVKMNITSSTCHIKESTVAEILNYIADNYGSEEKEPYDLIVNETHANVTVKRKNKIISAGSDILYNGDELTITAEGAEGYDLSTLTVNGETFVSGNKVTVNGHKITIAASGSIKTFDLGREATNCTIAVTKDGQAVDDGENALEFGDEIVITATANEGYAMSSLKVNGEDFVSGETYTVAEDVAIVGAAEAEEVTE